MKISKDVRELYQDILPKYEQLKQAVDELITTKKQPRWHYESRVKKLESYALKLETGRVRVPNRPDDLFACTLVVENHSRIAMAEKFIEELFDLDERKPKSDSATHLAPENFGFDDLRMYVKWKQSPALRESALTTMLFEVQIKTFLQHAWGIATHDFIYKSDDVDWAETRIAFQVKAMLEHAELSIGEAKKLSVARLLGRCDREFSDLKATIAAIKSRWTPDLLPDDLKRLAQNIVHLAKSLEISLVDVWKHVDSATANERGAKSPHLSPYAATLDALFNGVGPSLFNPLERHNGRSQIYVPNEIELPTLKKKILDRIIRVPA